MTLSFGVKYPVGRGDTLYWRNTSLMKNSQLIILFVVLLCFSCNRIDQNNQIPPIGNFKVSPDTLLTTSIARFDCSASRSGVKGGDLYYRFDWNKDGVWDEEYSNDPVFMHRFYSAGTHEPIMEVLNSSGLRDTCSIIVNVSQGFSPPRAKFFVNPKLGNRVTEFIFDASVTEDDEDSIDSLIFRWDWEGDGIWDTGFGEKPVMKKTYYKTGSSKPVLEVIDSQGMISQYILDLEVNQTNPKLHIDFNWDPVHPLQEDTVIFDAGNCYNPDDPENILLYYWRFELGTNQKSEGWLGPFHEPVISHIFTMEHEYGVSLKIVDNQSLEKVLTKPISVYHLNRRIPSTK